jgi:hypothetical protein
MPVSMSMTLSTSFSYSVRRLRRVITWGFVQEGWRWRVRVYTYVPHLSPEDDYTTSTVVPHLSPADDSTARADAGAYELLRYGMCVFVRCVRVCDETHLHCEGLFCTLRDGSRWVGATE